SGHVYLHWTTAFEQNNKGFQIQKQNSSHEWQTLSFVSSHAENGNSTTDMSYTYDDMVYPPGTLYYRIAQTDADGKVHYSDVRTVTADDESSAQVKVYPNPSHGSGITVSTGGKMIHQLSLYDVDGKLLHVWNDVIKGSLVLGKLTPGFYTLSVTFGTEGTRVIRKLVVTN